MIAATMIILLLILLIFLVVCFIGLLSFLGFVLCEILLHLWENQISTWIDKTFGDV